MQLLTDELREKLPPLYATEGVSDPLVVASSSCRQQVGLGTPLSLTARTSSLGMWSANIPNSDTSACTNLRKCGDRLTLQSSGITLRRCRFPRCARCTSSSAGSLSAPPWCASGYGSSPRCTNLASNKEN